MRKNATRTENLMVVVADGKEVDIKASLEGVIDVLGKVANHRFFVLPTLPHDVLLGTDILTKLESEASIGGTILWPIEIDHETQECCEIYCTEGLKKKTPEEETKLQKFLEKELKVFKNITGVFLLIKHKIKVKTNEPIKQRYQPRNPTMQKIIDEEAVKMLAEGLIEPSHSPSAHGARQS